MRLAFAILLALAAGTAQAQMSGGAMFPGPGVAPYSGGGSCANDGPNGTVDLSKCSNAFYVATLIFG